VYGARLAIDATWLAYNGAVVTAGDLGVSTLSASGEWVGVELDEATGNPDESTGGFRGFWCERGHRVFVRASKVVLLAECDKDPVWI